MSGLKYRQRKATWTAFCLVALSTLFAHVSADTSLVRSETGTPLETNVPQEADPMVTSVDLPSSKQNHLNNEPINERAAEAARAYEQALQTLSTLPPFPLHYTRSSIDVPRSTSALAALFPVHRGPIASTMRILSRLRQQSWLPRVITSHFSRGGGKRREDSRGKVIKVLDLLQHAIELGHLDALYKLAQISLFPPSALSMNATRAFHAYEQHASLTGNATSQAMVAFFYATGYGKVVSVDQAKALLYYSFAALGGDQGSEMVLGYRHWSGIGVNEDCMTALEWYESAAEKSMARFLSGPPGGRTLLLTPTRLSDLAGGAYGHGASVASTGQNANRPVIKAAEALDAGETWEAVLEYYQFHANRGEIEFAYRLGKIFYQGSIYGTAGGAASGAEGVGRVPQDFHRARDYFLVIARHVWPRDNPVVPTLPKKDKVDSDTIVLACHAAFYLGRMHLRGEGVRPDIKVAKMWFERCAEYGDRECHNSLGIIWRDGLVDGKVDEREAMARFNTAAGEDLAEAQVNLGKYHYARSELTLAKTYFENAIRHGSQFEAYYYTANIHASYSRLPSTHPSSVAGSCSIAVSFYKLVAERGCWKEDLVGEAEMLWNTGGEKERERAMMLWWMASERGYEVAQNNLAFILDQDKSSLRFGSFTPTPSNETARLALTQWTRSAAQGSVDALVKVGDYYYHGLGVSDEPEALRWEKAAGHYHSAVEIQMSSSVAMWNLGWMYENGVGVLQDFHLAKRYYDMALETNPDAYLPVFLSILKLQLRSLWHTISGSKQKGLRLWSDEEDDHWYLGKAKDEFKKRSNAKEIAEDDSGRAKLEGRQVQDDSVDRSAPLEDMDDPIEWARRKRSEAERRDEPADTDPWDAAVNPRRKKGEEEDDEFWETIVLVLLCLTVSGLMWLRARWVAAREQEDRRAAEAQRPQERLPPQPGPPNDWNPMA